MVRGLVGTMLHVGRGVTSIEDFRTVIESKDCSNADFSVPPQGLFLNAVNYPESVWKDIE
jgi:tRNA pseudouridine38-40 synthase